MPHVDNAIILAAGQGTRMAPLTYAAPKGLVPVHGTPLIERQIEQLKAVGVDEIIVVVGYMAEAFHYLAEKYGATLVANPDYDSKNNISSIYRVLAHLRNSYILVADNWLEDNLFATHEDGSWLSVRYIEGPTHEWPVHVDGLDRVTQIDVGGADCWCLAGPAFLTKDASAALSDLVRARTRDGGHDDDYWEDVVRDHLADLPPIRARRTEPTAVREFESLEELREFDLSYQDDVDNECLSTISRVFGVPQRDITGIVPLKQGMTNASFLFTVGGERFVYRHPGVGTERLIDRAAEKEAYELVAPLAIADEIIYFDGATGTKISRYYDGAQPIDPRSQNDRADAMRLLRGIHDAGLIPSRRFDLAERIAYYDSLVLEALQTRIEQQSEWELLAERLLGLRDRLAVPEVLCHVDFVYANVLRLPDGGIRVIDWEYAGAADPLLDLAMHAIYAGFGRAEVDDLLRTYLQREPTRSEEARLYLNVALGGYLWNLWTEFKEAHGDKFGTYRMDQAQYLVDYYEILATEGYLAEFGAPIKERQ